MTGGMSGAGMSGNMRDGMPSAGMWNSNMSDNMRDGMPGTGMWETNLPGSGAGNAWDGRTWDGRTWDGMQEQRRSPLMPKEG